MKLNQRGIANPLIIPIAGMGALIVILLGLVVYSFSQLDSARNERDEYAAGVVEEAKTEIREELQAEFDQKEKEPFLDFDGPDLLGGIEFKYPKIWSAVVEEDQADTEQLNAYFHPGIVNLDNEKDRSYAFRMQLLDDPYSEELQRFQSKIKKGDITSKAVTFNATEGVRLEGQLEEVDRGSMVILPLRDKTLKIWTESEQFRGDFDTLLESFTFNP